MSEENPLRPEFPLGFLGYRRRDVDVAFAQWSMLLRQLRAAAGSSSERAQSLERELEAARTETQELRSRELELTRMALEAQKTFDEMIRRAQVEALEVERDAETRGREIVAAAQARARALMAVAEEAAAELRVEIARRTNDASAEVEELLKLRDRLRTQAGPAPAEGDPAGSSPPITVSEGSGSMFDTFVEVEAGPFADFAMLSAFERALGRVDKVQDVYIRRFADERATIEVTLSEPAPLLDGLHAVLPDAFEVVGEDPAWLKLEVTSPLAGVYW